MQFTEILNQDVPIPCPVIIQQSVLNNRIDNLVVKTPKPTANNVKYNVPSKKVIGGLNLDLDGLTLDLNLTQSKKKKKSSPVVQSLSKDRYSSLKSADGHKRITPMIR